MFGLLSVSVEGRGVSEWWFSCFHGVDGWLSVIRAQIIVWVLGHQGLVKSESEARNVGYELLPPLKKRAQDRRGVPFAFLPATIQEYAYI